jgi:hypothetical protein
MQEDKNPLPSFSERLYKMTAIREAFRQTRSCSHIGKGKESSVRHKGEIF